MKIKSISLENYKVFQTLTLNNLPDLAVFVGANGTGKSTLFDVFAFLRDALTNNIQQALAKRGGFKEVISRKQVNVKQDTSRQQSHLIKIKIQFNLAIASHERLVTYHLELGEEEDGNPYIEREILEYKRANYGSPYHFLDFKKGKGYAITDEENFDKKDKDLDRGEQVLDRPDILAIKGLGQFSRFKAASAFRSFIENWHLSDFHISEARPSRDAGYAEHLSPTGENLPLVAQYMYRNHRERFNNILEEMKKYVPGVENVEAKDTEDGRIVLKFQDGSFRDPFIARYVSDGTIKMFAYLLLLNDPKPHPLLCIEEPENQLYPTLLGNLLERFRHYAAGDGTVPSRKGQVFITSHSPDMLNGNQPEEVYWLQKAGGYTTISRASEDEYTVALFNAGEQLGYLWKQNYFKGTSKKPQCDLGSVENSAFFRQKRGE